MDRLAELFGDVAAWSVEALVFDAKALTILRATPAMATALGYSREELPGMSIRNIAAGRDPSVIRSLLVPLVAGEIDEKVDSVDYRRKDGSVGHAGATFFRAGAPEPPGVLIMVFTDASGTEAKPTGGNSERRFVGLFHDSTELMLVTDATTGLIAHANPAACRFYGYEDGQLVGRPVSTINAEPEEAIRELISEAVLGRRTFHLRHRIADGTIRDVEVRTSRVEVDGRPYLYSIVRDITQEKDAQRCIERLSALTRGLAAAAGALLRTNTEQDVYDCLCRVAVETGKLKMAWVGLAEPGTRVIRLNAVFGDESGYLAEIGVFESGLPHAAGVSTSAIKTGRAHANNDLAAASPHPFPMTAVRHGLRSVAGIPLRAGSVVIGVFQCYSAETGYFGDEELAILGQLVSDAAARLGAIQREHDHRGTREALARSEERYRGLFQAAPLGIMVMRHGNPEVNDTLLDMFGYPDRETLEEAGLMALVTPDGQAGVDSVRKALADGNSAPTIFETTGLRMDGSTFPVLVEGAQMEIEGARSGIVFITDLSAMQAAEGAAQSMRAQYQLLVQSAPLAIISMDGEHIVRSWNAAAERLFGWSAAEAIGHVFPGGVSAKGRRELERAATRGGPAPHPYETLRKKRDGSTLSLRLWSSFIPGAPSGIPGFLVIAEDVTRERQLAIEHARLATAINQTASSVVVTDLDANIVYVNPAFEKTTGYGREEVLGKNPRVLQSGAQPRSFYAGMWAQLASGETWRGRFINRRKDGALFPEDASISPIRDENGRVSGYVAVKRDVSAQEQERAARAETEQRYRSLFENMREGLAYCQMVYVDGKPDDWIYLDVNSAFEAQTGLKDVVGKRISEVVPGVRESDPEVLATFGRVAAGGPPEHFERYVKAIGNWFEVSAYSPEPGRFVAIFDVITDRVLAEKALRNSNALLERTEAISHVGSWRRDLVAGTMTWSAEMYRIFGHDPARPGIRPEDVLPAAIHPEDLAVFQAANRTTAATNVIESVDVRIVRPDGEVRFVHIGGEAERDEAGRVVARVGFVQDITDRKRAEVALTESQALLRAVVNATPDAVYAKDPEGRYLLVNDEVSRIVGQGADQLIGRDDTALFPAEEARVVMDSDRAVLAGGRSLTYEEHVTTADGSQHWYLSTKGPLVAADGSVHGLFGVARDITERKRRDELADARARLLEYALEHSLEEFLEETLNEAERLTGSLIGFFHYVDETESHLTLQAWSTRTKAVFCRAEGAGQHYDLPLAGVWVDCVHERRPVIHNDYASLPHRKGMPEGHAPVVRELVVPVVRGERIRAILGVGNKATDYSKEDVETVLQLADLALETAGRKRAEDELRMSEAIYRTSIEQSPIAIGAHRSGRGLFANAAHMKMFGYETMEQLRELGPDDMVAPESRADAHERIRLRAEGFDTDTEYEFTALRRDGSTFPVLAKAAPVLLPDGPATLLFHVDLTEIKRAGEALRASEEKFAKAFHAAPLLVGIVDLATGAYVDVNDESLQVLGFDRDEVIGRTSLELGLLTPEDRDRLVAELYANGQIANLELDLHGRSRTIHGLMNGETIVIGGRNCLLTATLDISDRERAEQDREQLVLKLAQAQKMEAVGRLAGGVAHDFNNLLTAIGGFARTLEMDLSSGKADPEDAAQIRMASDRAATLTAKLLAFAGRHTTAVALLELTDAVAQIAPMLRRIVPERIEIETDLRPAARLMMDAAELDQVVLNLVVNASDSIPAIGRIVIRTGTVHHDAEFLAAHPGAQLGLHARLTVSDSGHGMDGATRERIFEPFFTTKASGQGTGLGLATVYGVVERMGGTIELSSAVGLGTTFHIDFPASEHVARPAPKNRDEAGGHGTERILVVEDEPIVRQFTSSVLRRLGYAVICADTPADAIEIPDGEYDLLVTDVIMPGMNGAQLALTLRTRRPSLPVLFVSGYAHDALGDLALDDANTALLSKPFTQASLSQAARRLLDAVPN